MTRQQAGVSAEAVAKLIAKWRNEQADYWGIPAVKLCADELETALREEGQAGVSASLSEIIARAKSKTPCASNYECLLADLLELQAALATAPPEQAAKARVEVCGMCGGFLQGNYCPACDATVDEDARDTVPALPQAVSAGALSAELADLTHTRSCPMLNPMSEEFCTCGLEWRIKLRTEMEMHNAWRKRAEEAEQTLAAHDQKVRAEVLEEAAEQFIEGWIRIKIRALASEAEEKPLPKSIFVGTQDDYCKRCGLVIMRPEYNYGIHPDAVCKCAAPAASKPEAGHE